MCQARASGPRPASWLSARSIAGWSGTRPAAEAPHRCQNASRTMLFNIHTGKWDDELLRLLRRPASVLPEVRCFQRGVWRRISDSLGPRAGSDRAASQAISRRRSSVRRCIAPGMTKNTYGTGCFMLLNTGDERCDVAQPAADDGCLEDWGAHGVRARKAASSSAAPSSSGCATDSASSGRRADVEALAASVPDNGGVYLVPAFAGLGAPHWDPYARGTIDRADARHDGGPPGAGRARRRSRIRSPICWTPCRRTPASRSTELRVDGGAARNNLLMQFQADVLGVPVVRPPITETTALGAAYLAGLAVGFWKNGDDLASQWRTERRFEPAMPASRVHELRARWTQALGTGQESGREEDVQCGRTDTISPARRGPAEGASERPYRPACSVTVRCPAMPIAEPKITSLR